MAKETKGKVEVKEATAEVASETIAKKPVEVDRNTLVKVRNTTNSTLIYKSTRSGVVTKWNNYGDEELMEFQELMTMKASSDVFLSKPLCVIVEDSDVATEVINKLGLRKLYNEMLDIKDIGGFFKMHPNEAIEQLKNAPEGTRELIADKARELVQNDLLDSVAFIKALQKELNIDLIMVQTD